jgi:Lar family restriction alleviation protein
MAEFNPLRPCPFCGNPHILSAEVPEVAGQFRQWCDRCGAYGPPGDSVEDAHKQWDRRKPELGIK